jgi:hypothetical protein
MIVLCYRMTAKGLTRQKQKEVKQVVFDDYIQRIPIQQTIDKIHKKMDVKLGENWICKLRARIKKSARQEIGKYQRDRYAYVQKYLDRIHAVEYLEKNAFQILRNEENDPSIQLRCISELRELQVLLTDLYQNLTIVTKSYVPELEQPSCIMYSDDNRKV